MGRPLPGVALRGGRGPVLGLLRWTDRRPLAGRGAPRWGLPPLGGRGLGAAGLGGLPVHLLDQHLDAGELGPVGPAPGAPRIGVARAALLQLARVDVAVPRRAGQRLLVVRGDARWHHRGLVDAGQRSAARRWGRRLVQPGQRGRRRLVAGGQRGGRRLVALGQRRGAARRGGPAGHHPGHLRGPGRLHAPPPRRRPQRGSRPRGRGGPIGAGDDDVGPRRRGAVPVGGDVGPRRGGLVAAGRRRAVPGRRVPLGQLPGLHGGLPDPGRVEVGDLRARAGLGHPTGGGAGVRRLDLGRAVGRGLGVVHRQRVVRRGVRDDAVGLVEALHQLRHLALGDADVVPEHERAELVEELVGAGVALRRVDREGPLQDRLQAPQLVGADRELHLGVEELVVLLDLLVGALRQERLADHQLEQDRARGEDVGPRRGVAPGRHLGRHVAVLAHHPAVALAGQRDLRAGDAEVPELDHPRARDEHVGGADVAVDDLQPGPVLELGGVGVVEGLEHLGDDVQRERELQDDGVALAGADDAGQVPPVDELHRQVEVVVLPAQVEDLHDVGVLQRDGDPRLVQEHRHERRVRGQLGQDPLDDADALEAADAREAGPVDLGHPADADQLLEPVASEAAGCLVPRLLAHLSLTTGSVRKAHCCLQGHRVV